METTLILSQIFFNCVASIGIIAFGAFVAVIAYRLVRIAKNLEDISLQLKDFSGDLQEKIEDAIDQISSLPILSYFLKKKRRHTSQKKGHSVE